jgi:hypothetical protein
LLPFQESNYYIYHIRSAPSRISLRQTKTKIVDTSEGEKKVIYCEKEACPTSISFIVWGGWTPFVGSRGTFKYKIGVQGGKNQKCMFLAIFGCFWSLVGGYGGPWSNCVRLSG